MVLFFPRHHLLSENDISFVRVSHVLEDLVVFLLTVIVRICVLHLVMVVEVVAYLHHQDQRIWANHRVTVIGVDDRLDHHLVISIDGTDDRPLILLVLEPESHHLLNESDFVVSLNQCQEQLEKQFPYPHRRLISSVAQVMVHPDLHRSCLLELVLHLVMVRLDSVSVSLVVVLLFLVQNPKPREC